ncbi:hypothetical protein [Oceaniglobus indicus]|uniref:hypothetical protein n=1 Tax=Oceaniglobus indicus TaxID=2047749 RepID=UPI001F4EAC9B|nr:hypothetical protein [Oceaniglobus indicus]
MAPPVRKALSRRHALALAGVGTLAAAGAVALWPARGPRLAGAGQMANAYRTPLAPPVGGLNVYHLGHSLVGRDMPAMLAQMAGAAHRYDSQLGWGTSLRDHWEPSIGIEGFAHENDHPRFRPARPALESGLYDAVVLTEMVELRDAIRWHESARYFELWGDLARRANPAVRVYLYETWHWLNDPDGFRVRLDRDYAPLWKGEILAADVAAHPDRPAHVIPAGQVMAAVLRAVESAPLPGLSRAEDLFAKEPGGAQDNIHFNDIGAYLVAATHYAVLYHRSPVGLPHRLLRADGMVADAPSPEAAALIQRTVWDVVTSLPETGVAG